MFGAKVEASVFAKKEKVRVVMKNATWYEFDKPDDFNMIGYVTQIRAAGYILNPVLYTPATEIQTIFIYPEDRPPQVQGTVIDFPKAPA